MSKKEKKKKYGRPGFYYLDILDYLNSEKKFLLFILISFILAIISVNLGQMAMWVGFAFAAYSAVANDSIQSLGTFIESNYKRKWWVLWLYIGSIFLVTIIISWVVFNGDVTYQRLINSRGETEFPHPDQFSFYQVLAPLVLLIITRLRMPVSTTFLLLSVFSSSSSGISAMVYKSVSGYVIAFILSFIIWYSLYRVIKKYFKHRKTSLAWSIIQWIMSGLLWSVWVMQDGANIVVFLPRHLDIWGLIIFASVIFIGLGILFYMRGDKIQRVVSEKSRIADVRAATLIDFTYLMMLIYKLLISTIPLSTTWVFLGIIGGREIAISLARKKSSKKHKKKAVVMIVRDLAYAITGLIISIALATGANPAIREEVMGFFSGLFHF